MTQPPPYCSIPDSAKQSEAIEGTPFPRITGTCVATDRAIVMNKSTVAVNGAPESLSDGVVSQTNFAVSEPSDDVMGTKMPPPPFSAQAGCLASPWNSSVVKQSSMSGPPPKCSRGSLPFKKRRLHPFHQKSHGMDCHVGVDCGLSQEENGKNTVTGTILTVPVPKEAFPLSSCPVTPTSATMGTDWSGGTVSAPTSRRPDWSGGTVSALSSANASITSEGTNDKSDVYCRATGGHESNGIMMGSLVVKSESCGNESSSHRSEDALGGATCRIAALALVASHVASAVDQKGDCDMKLNRSCELDCDAGVPAAGLTDTTTAKNTRDASDMMTKPEMGGLKHRSSRPYLPTPLPNGCHARTCRNNSYCRRLPRYNGSVYCKIHYQQYILGGEGSGGHLVGTSESATVQAHVFADGGKSGFDKGSGSEHSSESIEPPSGGADGKEPTMMPVMPSLSPSYDATSGGESSKQQRLAVTSPALPFSGSHNAATTLSSSNSSDRRFTGLRPDEKRCEATTTRGRPCTFVAVNGTKYCHLHSSYEGHSTGSRRHISASSGPSVALPPPLTSSSSVGCEVGKLGLSAPPRGTASAALGVQDSGGNSDPSVTGGLGISSALCIRGQSSAMACGADGNVQSCKLSSTTEQLKVGSSSTEANEQGWRQKLLPHLPEQTDSRSALSPLAGSALAGNPSSMVLLSSIPSDQWSNKLVMIAVGPLANHTARVVKWGNGWVTVKPSTAVSAKGKTRGGGDDNVVTESVLLHNRRAMELYVLKDASTDATIGGHSVAKPELSQLVSSAGLGHGQITSPQILCPVADHSQKTCPKNVGSQQGEAVLVALQNRVDKLGGGSQVSLATEKLPSDQSPAVGKDERGGAMEKCQTTSVHVRRKGPYVDDLESSVAKEKQPSLRSPTEEVGRREPCVTHERRDAYNGRENSGVGATVHQTRDAPQSFTGDCADPPRGSSETFQSETQSPSIISAAQQVKPGGNSEIAPEKAAKATPVQANSSGHVGSVTSSHSNSALDRSGREKENKDLMDLTGAMLENGHGSGSAGAVKAKRAAELPPREGEGDVQSATSHDAFGAKREDSAKLVRDKPLAETLSLALNSRRGNLDLLFGTAALERSRRTKFKPERYEDKAMIERKRRSHSESEDSDVGSLKAPASPRARKRKDSCGVDLHKKTKTKSTQ